MDELQNNPFDGGFDASAAEIEYDVIAGI